MDLVLVYEGDQGTWTRRSFAKTKIEARYQGFFVLWECELSRYVWRMKKKNIQVVHAIESMFEYLVVAFSMGGGAGDMICGAFTYHLTLKHDIQPIPISDSRIASAPILLPLRILEKLHLL